MTHLDARSSWLALLILMAASNWSQSVSAAEPDAAAELIEAGRYREAYEATRKDGVPQPALLAQTARTLLRISIDSDQEPLRRFGLRAARTLSDPELVAAARRIVHKGGRYETALALDVLANSDVAGSREEFLHGLKSPFRTIRFRSLRALAQLKDPALAEQFATLLTNDPDPELRAFAAGALAQTGAVTTHPALYRALDDPETVVRQESVRALVALGDPGIAGAIRRRLTEARPEERVRVIRLAALVPDAELAQALAPLLGDGDGEVRAFAASAILSILQQGKAAKAP